jgi:ATP-dependent RNA circularization protein (DNA/RNA ligase family)
MVEETINGHLATPLTRAVRVVVQEYEKAASNYGKFHSYHEGYSVILEELDELWAEIKKKGDVRDKRKIRSEAKQVAAMAIRFMIDLCDDQW